MRNSDFQRCFQGLAVEHAKRAPAIKNVAAGAAGMLLEATAGRSEMIAPLAATFAARARMQEASLGGQNCQP
jgi:hypothetical protein